MSAVRRAPVPAGATRCCRLIQRQQASLAINRLAKRGIHGVPKVFDPAERDAAVRRVLSTAEWLRSQTPEPVRR